MLKHHFSQAYNRWRNSNNKKKNFNRRSSMFGIGNRFSKTAIGRKLKNLLQMDLNFHTEPSTNGLHAFHAFAAKFPPQLPRLFIRGLTESGETILDPMCGSGTTLVEATLANRHAVGVDIDPLAYLQTLVKTTPLDPVAAAGAVKHVGERAENLLVCGAISEADLEKRFDDETRRFIDYWFLKKTQFELVALLQSIETETRNDDLRRFLQVVFSSIIVTKSGGVSMARDLAHSRPHLDKSKEPRNSIKAFLAKGIRSAEAMKALSGVRAPVDVIKGDARKLPLQNDSVHLIVTSPPYANAIDYPRAHKFSLVWLGNGISEMTRLRSEYIGTEKIRPAPAGLPSSIEDILSQIGERDKRREQIIRQYFFDMFQILREMARVLVPGRAAILVIGPSTVRGIKINTPECIAVLGEHTGLEVVSIRKRELDRNRRMLPVSRVTNENGIELRVHEESVIGFLKPR